jgi:hypothetical protein
MAFVRSPAKKVSPIVAATASTPKPTAHIVESVATPVKRGKSAPMATAPHLVKKVLPNVPETASTLKPTALTAENAAISARTAKFAQRAFALSLVKKV